MRTDLFDSYHDLLYGQIAIPSYLAEFTRLPEFVRLRHVRLSNVDSIQFKDFATAGRWEHGVAAAYLAGLAGRSMDLAPRMHVQLEVAALLHDVATPPFAHTAEAVLDGFDHAIETRQLFRDVSTEFGDAQFPVFAGRPSGFRDAVRRLGRRIKLPIDADEIADWISGEGELGYLIASYVDLDNLDNVIRASHLMGLEVDPDIAIKLAKRLGTDQRPLTHADAGRIPELDQWEGYRQRLYAAFFLARPDERARQSWLQTIMRRALRAGLPRLRLIWNTDDGFLRDAARLGREEDPQLAHLVADYALMRPSVCVAEVEIHGEADARRLASPKLARWLEGVLSGEDALVSVSVARRRVRIDSGSLLEPPDAILRIFAMEPISSGFYTRRLRALNGILGRDAPSPTPRSDSQRFKEAMTTLIRGPLPALTTEADAASTKAELESVGDWGFRGRRNPQFYQYPATWVHEIPANLIRALGLRGQAILDPFGGTGETAVEGIRHGCAVTSIDNSRIACMVARARTTYLTPVQIQTVRAFASDLDHVEPIDSELVMPIPVDALLEWYHPETFVGLDRLRRSIFTLPPNEVQAFLLVCFAAIVNSCSSRRGMSFGHFADNTPLGRNKDKAIDFVDPIPRFRERVRRNLGVYESVLAQIERYERHPRALYDRATIMHANSADRESWPPPQSVNAVITSPPYLGMIDYALSQRLQYYWLDEKGLDSDFSTEIGARRHRSRASAISDYRRFIDAFAREAECALVPGGFVAAVLGVSTATRFEDMDFAAELATALSASGLRHTWTHDREVSGHRIHNLHKLKSERILVYQKPG